MIYDLEKEKEKNIIAELKIKLSDSELAIKEKGVEIETLKSKIGTLQEINVNVEKYQQILEEENKVIIEDNDNLRRKVRSFKEMSLLQRIFYKGE